MTIAAVVPLAAPEEGQVLSKGIFRGSVRTSALLHSRGRLYRPDVVSHCGHIEGEVCSDQSIAPSWEVRLEDKLTEAVQLPSRGHRHERSRRDDERE